MPRPRKVHLSRHLAFDRGDHFRIRTHPPPWHVVLLLLTCTALLWLTAGFPATCACFVTVAIRIGPMNELVRRLPPILSMTDFENRRYRVVQSMWLVSFCVAIYSILPEHVREAPSQGWKLNLVTMETSMSSGIAAAYGYSVAGGVPGGLLAEHVLHELGKEVVIELMPLFGPTITKAGVSFGLFYLTGSIMHLFAKCAYAFAHRREDHVEPPQDRASGSWGGAMRCPHCGSEMPNQADAGSSALPHSPSPRRNGSRGGDRWKVE